MLIQFLFTYLSQSPISHTFKSHERVERHFMKIDHATTGGIQWVRVYVEQPWGFLISFSLTWRANLLVNQKQE